MNQNGLVVRAAHAVILSAGWPRRLLAFAAGAFGALAMAPVDFFPALIVPMTIAVWLIDGSGRASGESRFGASTFRSALEAARAGWWLGFGYFVAGLWWLGAAFLVEADQFAWALPFGVIGLPAGLAFFTALGCFMSRLLWSEGSARILALAVGIGISEWLRGVVLTGFPWNDFGMALGGNLVLAQIASIVGLHGLTFIAVALAAAPACLADMNDMATSRSWMQRLRRPVILSSLVLAGLALFGAGRLLSHQTEWRQRVKLRIMQPNLQQDAKFRAENKDPILEHYIRLSGSTTSENPQGLATVTHLIWPESAFPFILSRDAEALARIGAIIPKGSYLITGAARAEPARNGGRNRALYYNSIHVIESGGVIADTYDKAHLVPFGEYLPLGWLLEKLRLRQFVHIPGGFEAARQRRGLSVPGLPRVAALVCYEAIFPGEVMPMGGRGERAGAMLNVTNDGWFGMTSGPYQHLSAARLRTIEEGVPLIRAANTGVSAIVDPYGRIVAQLGLGTAGVLDSFLPAAAPPTFFSKWPNASPASLLLLCFLGALLLRPRWRSRTGGER